MTGPHDDYEETRPISVAELLARNGTIGAPPVGGRRRRRRGNTDSVSVAELTGEIPVINTDEIPAVAEEHDEDADTHDLPRTSARTNGNVGRVAEPLDEPEPHYDPPVGSYEPEYDEFLDSIRGPRRTRPRAEQMAPDPFEHDADEHVGGLALEEQLEEQQEEQLEEQPEEADDLPSYLRGEREHLFGGADHDEITARAPTTDRALATAEPETTLQKVLRGGWIVLQSIIAVVFGAGLFLGFDQLWKWNNIVALVLSVLVILGLVVAVRIVRKTEDIASTLIAVAVGALVTLGPLALLQSN